jgi:hypothetical protein
VTAIAAGSRLRRRVPARHYLASLYRDAVPGRGSLQLCLGLLWLLDAALQFQPYMFSPFFATQVILPAAAGNPVIIASSITWAGHAMLQHAALYNAIFAMIQLVIAVGILVRRTRKLALAASIAWAVAVWWFGEGLGGIFTGASPLVGAPGSVIIYALIAILLWPADRKPVSPAASAAESSPLGPFGARILWLAVWTSFCFFLLLPGNRAADAVSQVVSVTDGQPGWVTTVMNAVAGIAGQHGLAISIALTVLCAFAAAGVQSRRLVRPALAVAAAVALFFWIAEGLGGILTGQGTDPNSGLVLVLLAACFWPHRVPHVSAAAACGARDLPVSG